MDGGQLSQVLWCLVNMRVRPNEDFMATIEQGMRHHRCVCVCVCVHACAICFSEG
jgi:hypothetical protein